MCEGEDFKDFFVANGLTIFCRAHNKFFKTHKNFVT